MDLGRVADGWSRVMLSGALTGVVVLVVAAVRARVTLGWSIGFVLGAVLFGGMFGLILRVRIRRWLAAAQPVEGAEVRPFPHQWVAPLAMAAVFAALALFASGFIAGYAAGLILTGAICRRAFVEFEREHRVRVVARRPKFFSRDRELFTIPTR